MQLMGLHGRKRAEMNGCGQSHDHVFLHFLPPHRLLQHPKETEHKKPVHNCADKTSHDQYQKI